MDYCKEKFQESVLPMITVVQKEVCPSFPAEDNPNGVTSACDQFCTLWTSPWKKKIRFMMCNEENATCFFLSPQPCQNMFWSEPSILDNITDFKFLLK